MLGEGSVAQLSDTEDILIQVHQSQDIETLNTFQ